MIDLQYSGGSRISCWGGAEPLGGTDLQCGCFSAKMYAKTKELDSIGGGHHIPVVPPLGSANAVLLELRKLQEFMVFCKNFY